MSSSFVAQQQESRNPHQNPVRSHKGGYLRCPFNISSSYAELAERRVREDLARGGRGRAAVADKDGVVVSSSTGPPVDRDDSDGDFGGRPWSRAGVGASRLSGKEKRVQQEQAELIYGRGALAGGDDISADTGAAPVRSGLCQEHMFAVHARDQVALQKVMPRAVREKVKRRRVDGLKKERFPLGHDPRRGSAPSCTSRAAGSEAAGEDGVERSSEDHTTLPPHNGQRPSSSPAAGLSRDGASVPPRAAGGKCNPSSTDTCAERSSRSAPPYAPLQGPPRQAPTPIPTSTAPSRPKNRMQMLDDLRASALMGKRRR
ncbi:hypothetical protein JIQ42_03428 [Leishmania sp. Namibia]|uniref:hypothetical protein n=1 Tax=Leishmania sp. Namibia TaxID=2802991 RepID=UPI001B4BC7CB|nr:hypothetical protein JIQ42_03428 [Leishmania sp. Namibia]